MADEPADRMGSAGNAWHEGRLIDVHVYVNQDGSEGWGATFGHGLSLERRRSLLSQVAQILSDARLPDEPTPRRPS